MKYTPSGSWIYETNTVTGEKRAILVSLPLSDVGGDPRDSWQKSVEFAKDIAEKLNKFEHMKKSGLI